MSERDIFLTALDISHPDASRPAVEWLRKAVAAGYRDRAHLDADPDLAPLRGRPDFRALVGSLRYTAPPPRPVVK